MIREAVSLFAKGEDKALRKAFSIGRNVAVTGYHKGLMNHLAQVVDEGHPALDLIKKLAKQINPNCRDKFVVNFFVGALKCSETRKRILKEEGVKVPFFLVISPTMRCNLRCTGCYAGDYSKKDDMEFELMDRILTEAKELGIHFITISGGEPFYWPHLLDILEKHQDMAFQIYTNGTLIDEAMATRLVELGNAAPCISIEGTKADTENRRGDGIYDTVMETMERLWDKGLIFGFSATVTRLNVNTLTSEEFIDQMIGKGCSFGWYFMYVPVGMNPDMSLMVKPEQRDDMRRWLTEVRHSKPIFIGDFWNDGCWVGGCIAGGREYLHIINDGDVEPCVFTHFAVDNIKDKPLKEVISSPFFRSIQQRQPYNDNLLRPCWLIDAPQMLREVIAETGAHPTHPGAEALLTSLAAQVDEYAKKYGELADRVWEEEYLADPVWKDRIEKWNKKFREQKVEV
jgi:MoaA/NifB/PqqE/SkfB family radical SAM enzyme